MEIKIKRLRLRNFKGVRDADYLFNGRNATIEGPNGSGKSTVFDAFTWLLFGKDHRDQTSSTFEIKTIDPATGRPYPREDHWVEAELVVDGQGHVLRRSWTENWVKPTGETEEVLKGHNSGFYVDGVDVRTKAAFDAVVSGWLREDSFKLLTNPHYFIDDGFTDWKERRKALLDLVKDDPGRAKVRADFADVVDKLSGRSVEDYRKRLALEKAANKKDLAITLSRIDGMREALPQDQDTNAVAVKLAELKARRDKAVAELKAKADALDKSIASADALDASRKEENAAVWPARSRTRSAPSPASGRRSSASTTGRPRHARPSRGGRRSADASPPGSTNWATSTRPRRPRPSSTWPRTSAPAAARPYPPRRSCAKSRRRRRSS